MQTKAETTKRLCKHIVKEAINRGYADMWDESWNKDAHVEVTLTIAELRMAASLINFHPTKAQLHKADEAHEWQEYLAELDSIS